MDKNNIEVPNINSIEIKDIVEKGIKPKVSFFSYLRDMYKKVGFKNIFHDISEIIFIVLITLFTLCFAAIIIKDNDYIEVWQIYSFIFVVSPILYLLISFFSFFNTKQNGTYEVEMICKYNIYQLSALRMFIFSIVSILCNSILIFMFFIVNEEINLLRALAISITALFLFSSVFLYVLLNTSHKITKYFMIAGWIIINLALMISKNNYYNVLLTQLPIYVHLGLTISCIYLYIKSLKKLINFRSVKGEM
ncbi:MAG TPA: hypothetical protein DEF85_09385 [Clostridiaceae bacterium]|jgi:hypothetical protein|nr:hypothetical protein [Clostridiaceae bacterium]HBG39772.1 hypothetical protein [Clostridiaceae bacterium]HBN28827.1 hypothetical protein [Clostridiaceae bacterium]HBX49088.1 hypothetical protein [Clostridiaceae bacterium]HCL49386.1 hypothetical protein [Clostridiaceae bacterium]